MELLLWIVLGIVVGLGVIALAPVLIVGSWFVIISVILGLADGAIWLLDQGWRKRRSRGEPVPALGLGDATSGKPPVRVLTAPLTITSNV